MDVVERLTPEQASESTLLALTHVHRYELAAELCRGIRVLDLCCGSGYGARMLAETASSVTGIDIHEPSIARANDDAASIANLDFEAADAIDVLRRPLADSFDAIVLFEGLEHVADLDGAVEELRRHAGAGMTVIVSLPNSRPFGEENPHHVTEFDREQASAVFDRIGASVRLYQFHAEGSLIRSAEEGPLEGRSTLAGRAELDHCNHLIAIANPPAGPDDPAAWTRMQLSAAPEPNTYMLELERANKRLWRANRRLGRERIGVADSAAAAALARRRKSVRTLRPRAAGFRRRLKRAVVFLVPHGLIVIRARNRQRDDEG